MTSEADIPLLKRFFLGGSGEMRGWGRYEVSPLSGTGGLLRFDFGYQLKRLDGLRIEGEPQKHRWRLNFGIGEAF